MTKGGIQTQQKTPSRRWSRKALGYSSVAFTMDTYSHVIEGMQEDVIALLDDSWFLFR